MEDAIAVTQGRRSMGENLWGEEILSLKLSSGYKGVRFVKMSLSLGLVCFYTS